MSDLLTDAAEIALSVEDLYRDLHAHPELAYAEHRTAGIVADRLTALGLEVHTGIATTGVAGVLRNGDGPTVALRADMDALPVREETGLDYASTAVGTLPDGTETPLMHACGHDVHVTCLLGAVELLHRRAADWSGTLVAIFQPAEEAGDGARTMLADGLYDRAPRPDIVLGQHVAPAPAGVVGVHPGAAFAATDMLSLRLFGRGGHGSRPETTVDPVVMAAHTVTRLQTIVARELAATDMAVVTVGTLHAGTAPNIIADEATLGLSVRTADAEVRETVLAAIERIARAEAQAAGADREPELERRASLPPVVNDPAASARVVGAFTNAFGARRVIDPGAVTGSEDVGELATAAGAPIVYWILGGTDPALFGGAHAEEISRDVPSNHSPLFAPVVRPTLETGIGALGVAALEWLGRPGAQPG